MTQETLAAFMARALYDPERGYYIQKVPIGAPQKGGDFVTAPEISQLFGEMVAAWVYAAWQRMGTPSPCYLVECGPGRGTLMSDILRTIQVTPEKLTPFEIRMMEISPRLRTLQQKRFEPLGSKIQWVRALEEIPAGAAIFVGNEFLDAFPLDQYQLGDQGWQRRYVLGDGVHFEPVWREEAPPPGFFDVWPGTLEAGIYEYAPAMRAWFEAWLKRGGALAGLWIDYGYREGHGETLQAVRAHKRVSPFEAPGSADLTAHVNFETLEKEAVRAGMRGRFQTQAAFLTEMGMEMRLRHLLRYADPFQQQELMRGAARLVSPSAMGTLFKVLEVYR